MPNCNHCKFQKDCPNILKIGVGCTDFDERKNNMIDNSICGICKKPLGEVELDNILMLEGEIKSLKKALPACSYRLHKYKDRKDLTAILDGGKEVGFIIGNTVIVAHGSSVCGIIMKHLNIT